MIKLEKFYTKHYVALNKPWGLVYAVTCGTSYLVKPLDYIPVHIKDFLREKLSFFTQSEDNL